MREIIFRGKSVTDSRWVFGDLSNYGDCKTITTVKDFSIIDSCEVIPETVGQYTGLKDKNGKRIFAQDIIETKYGRICEVIWFSTDTYCGWDLVPIGQYDCNPPDKWDLWNCGNLVVIGNIFDNQELLKG